MIAQPANVVQPSAIDTLNFFMVFYGLLLGLAITEILSGIAPLLREDRLPRERVGLLAPLLAALLLMEIMTSFIDAWDRLRGISIELDDLLRPTLIGLGYFIIATIALPRPLPAGASLDDHVLLRKGRVAAILIVINLLVLTYEVGTITDAAAAGEWINVTVWIAGNAWLFGAYAGMWHTKRRDLTAWFMVCAIAFFLTYYVEDPTCLFSQESQQSGTCLL